MFFGPQILKHPHSEFSLGSCTHYAVNADLAQCWVHTWHSVNGAYQPLWFIRQFKHESSLPSRFPSSSHFSVLFLLSRLHLGVFPPTFSGSPWFLHSQIFLFLPPFKSSALLSFYSPPIFFLLCPDLPIFLTLSPHCPFIPIACVSPPPLISSHLLLRGIL